jgi:hypothetical protein
MDRSEQDYHLYLLQQVDALHQKIESLPEQTLLRLASLLPQLMKATSSLPHHPKSLTDLEDDNNVIADQTNVEIQGELPPEVQVQILTARLTAAYTRIGILEDQLFYSKQ